MTDVSIGCPVRKNILIYRWENGPRGLRWSVEDLTIFRLPASFSPCWLWNVLRFLLSSIVSLGAGVHCGGSYRDLFSRVPQKRCMKLITRQNITSQRVWFGRIYSLSWNLRVVSTNIICLGRFSFIFKIQGSFNGRASAPSRGMSCCLWGL